MLNRGGPLARTKPIRRTSKGLCATKRSQRRAYAAADPENACCAACGSSQHLEHSHHFGQGNYPQHRLNPLNFWLEYRACHALFENNKTGYATAYPDAWAAKWALMQQVDPKAAALFEMKNPSIT